MPLILLLACAVLVTACDGRKQATAERATAERPDAETRCLQRAGLSHAKFDGHPAERREGEDLSWSAVVVGAHGVNSADVSIDRYDTPRVARAHAVATRRHGLARAFAVGRYVVAAAPKEDQGLPYALGLLARCLRGVDAR